MTRITTSRRTSPARTAETAEFHEGAIQIDAKLLADGLELEPAAVPALLRSRSVTSVCERGIGEDAGRYRLTFFHRSRRLRLVIDEDGRLIRRSLIDFGERPTAGRPLRKSEGR